MANIWKTFEKLLPKKQTFIGTVTSINSAKGLSSVTLPSEQTIVVRGDSVAVGSNCIIEDDVIVASAPNLDVMTNITIY